jgi:hypothetical protein
MKRLITFIRVTLWFAVWFAFLAFLIETFVTKKMILTKLDLNNIKATNLLLEKVLFDRKIDISNKNNVLKTTKLTAKGQKIAKHIDFLQHITDSTSQILEQLDLRTATGYRKSIEILQVFRKQIDVYKNLADINYIFRDYFENYFTKSDTKWLFLLHNRPEVMYQTMELQPKLLLQRLHYEAFIIYYKEIEKEKL